MLPKLRKTQDNNDNTEYLDSEDFPQWKIELKLRAANDEDSD